MLNLSSRLRCVADFVRTGCRLADIGTDHAYLPVFLLKNGIINYAVCCDINSGPLNNAKHTAEVFGVSDIEMRMGNGLESISADEVNDVVIAGMGGETIIGILNDCQWIKNKKFNFVFQPMTRAELLREYLLKNGFEIISEKCTEENEKLYSIINSRFNEHSDCKCNNVEKYIGKLYLNKDIFSKKYIEKQINKASKITHGLKKSLPNESNEEKIIYYNSVFKDLTEVYNGMC